MLTLGMLLTGAYLLASPNFSILLLRILGKDDPREHFSGNPGTTNVYRQAGLPWAAVVLSLDLSRSAAIALVGMLWLPMPMVGWLAVAAVLGNRFPLFHGLQGGKGVAALLGFVVAIAPFWAMGACLTWVLIYVFVRKPYVGSLAMVAVLVSGQAAAAEFHSGAILSGLIVMALVVQAHHKNIRRRGPLAPRS